MHPKERVFLSCISPTPLSYDNIQRGVHHRKYLEMDPKFAAELDITTDTEVRHSLAICSLFEKFTCLLLFTIFQNLVDLFLIIYFMVLNLKKKSFRLMDPEMN